LLVANRLGYLDNATLVPALELVEEVGRIIAGLRNSLCVS